MMRIPVDHIADVSKVLYNSSSSHSDSDYFRYLESLSSTDGLRQIAVRFLK